MSRSNQILIPLAMHQNQIEKKAIIGICFVLKTYKLCISPFLGQNCRFYPSCSDYVTEALRMHGILRGFVLALNRLCKCHPFHSGGVDLVPSCKLLIFPSSLK